MRLIFILVLLSILSIPAFSKEKIQQIKVLTLNTWMIPLQRKMAKARAEAIGRELGNYDIAMMQEAFTAGIRKTMATVAKSSNLSNCYQTRKPFRINSGMYSFTRFEVTKTDFMRFFNCRGVQCFSGKGVLYMQIKLPNGQRIDLFSTHLQAYEKDRRVRNRQLKRVIKYINRKNDKSIPVIFVGDFNIIAETQEYNELVLKLDGFRDVWKTGRPNDDGFTWNPSINTWAKYDYDESQLLQRLDYIFIRDGKRASISIKDVNFAFNSKKVWYGVYKNPQSTFVSDHFGVEANLLIETR